MAMNIDIYKQLIVSAVDSYRALNDDTKTQLKTITSAISPFVGVEIKQEHLIPELSNWNKGLFLEKQISTWIPSGASLLNLLLLHDNTFLAVFSNAPAIHLTSDFSIISELPFLYQNPTIGGIAQSAYFSLGGSCVVTFNEIIENVDELHSYVFFTCPISHIVQVYKYVRLSWNFVTTIGSVGNIGNSTSSNLDTPTKITAILSEAFTGSSTQTFKIFISCTGINSIGSSHFLKYLTMDIAGNTKQNFMEASYSGQYQTVSTVKGSLQYSETSIISSLDLDTTGTTLTIVNTINSTNQIGVLKVNSILPLGGTPNQTQLVTSIFPTLPYNDMFLVPTVIRNIGSLGFLCGDISGHVCLLTTNLKDTGISMGKPKSVEIVGAVPLTYPFELDKVVDILINPSTNLVNIITTTGVYTSNILNLMNQELVYALQPLSFSGRIEKIIGLEAGSISFSLDLGAVWKPIEAFALTTIPIGTSIYIKVTKKSEKLKKEITDFNNVLSISSLLDGYLVFSL